MNANKIAFCFLIASFTFQYLIAQNFDEFKVGDYQLPKILETQDGEAVSTIAEWEKVRRPEILKLFEDNVYGQVPKDFDNIKFNVIKNDKRAMDGKATMKEVVITVTRNQKSIAINLLMFTPNNVRKPVPIFLVINHKGIQTMDITRQNKDGFCPAEEVIDAGYGISGFNVSDLSADDKMKYTEGVLSQLYPEQLALNNGMRTLGAWSWGASRAIDYFETDKEVDATRVISVGHSRGGKSSLWFSAQDQRVAIAISNESGKLGAALSRRGVGENLKLIYDHFPYWFCSNFQQYTDNVDKLPVDQHMLIGLIAPRVVYVAVAQEDLWSDPKGEFLGLREAQDVYRLYGIGTNLPDKMPGINEQIIRPKVGFHNREGNHNMTLYDWKQFIRFADNYFNQDKDLN